MAERIENLSTNRGGAPRKYPWELWTDGSAWRIVKGQDYDIPTVSMAAIVRGHARRNGLEVFTAQTRDQDGVEFQFSAGDSMAEAS